MKQLSLEDSQSDNTEQALTRFERQQKIIQGLHDKFKSLSRAERRNLEMRAERHTSNKRRAFEIEKEALEQQLALLEFREVEERRLLGTPTHSDKTRFSDSVVEFMCSLWSELNDNRVPLHSLKQRKTTSPSAPPVAQQKLLLALEARMHFFSAQCPWWCRYVCDFRDWFANCAIYKESESEVGPPVKVYYLLYAKQNPLTATFLECEPVGVGAGAVAGGRLRPAFRPRHFWQFQCTGFVHHLAKTVPFDEDDDLWVLHGLRTNGRCIDSCHAPCQVRSLRRPIWHLEFQVVFVEVCWD